MKQIWQARCLVVTGVTGLLFLLAAGTLFAATGDKALKICADPYMLPFSNHDQQGYENKIAQLFASELGWELKYEWFPQRIGFIRNTLRAEAEDGPGFKCDLVISVPESFELTATTDPYMTTTYVLVYVRGRGLDQVSSPEQLAELSRQGKDIRVGISDRGPGQLWFFRNGLMGNFQAFLGQPGDPKRNPGKVMMEALAAGDIDAAIVWGPTAGYFSGRLPGNAEFVILPLHDDPNDAEMRFEFTIAMGVRHGDKAWRDTVNKLIETHQQEINAILTEYGIPLLPIRKHQSVDDDD